MRNRAAFLAVLALCVTLPGQDFLLSRTDASQVPGRIVGLRGEGAARALVFATKDGEVDVPWTAILGLHGPSPQVDAAVSVHLVGGDELKGVIRGGDDEGETLSLATELGSLTIPIDRLRTLVFRALAKTWGPEAPFSMLG